MSIWLLLWIVISITLLGFLFWTLFILYGQKKTWKAFAQKHKLRFQPNALMQSPMVEGSIDEYKMSLFVGEHVTTDLRGFRKLSAIEVNLHGVLPIECCIASGGMIRFVKDLNLKSEIRPEHKDWSKAYIASGSHKGVLESYLNDERVDVLTKLMKIPNNWVILICRKDQMLLRVDTSDPLSSQEYLEKLMRLMLKAAKTLELKKGEFESLKAHALKNPVRETDLSLDDDVSGGGLTLEDDEAQDVNEDVEGNDKDASMDN